MVTDTERREVAEKLRASIPGDGVMRRGDKGWSLLYRTIFGHYMGHQSAGRTYSEVAGRLADLIEPPAQCPYYHSDRHHCSIHDVPAIDRDALIELAEGLECKADDIIRAAKHAQFSGLGPSMGEAEHDAYEWRCIAHRIREALGVES